MRTRQRPIYREAATPKGRKWNVSCGDKLPGQCDLDGITVLVQDIERIRASRGWTETMIFLAISSRRVICEEPA